MDPGSAGPDHRYMNDDTPQDTPLRDTPEEEPMEPTQANAGPPGTPQGALPPGGTGSGGGTASGRPLHRSRSDMWLTGVAGGLAEHFGVDPLLVRALFVVFAFVGGLGIALYLAGWALIPVEGSDRAVGQDLIDRARNSPSWVAIVLLVIGTALVAGQMAGWGGPLFWGALLIGGGIWLYRRPDTPPSPPPAQPPVETQPGAGSRPAGEIISAEVRSAAQAASERARTHRTDRPRRSHLGRLTVAAGLVLVGVIAVLHNTGAVTASPRHYPAIAMLVIGIGLLVGTFWGRSRGLIFLGLLVVPFALTTTLVRVPFSGGTGERFFTPATAAEAANPYHLAAGQLNVDLTEMDWSQPVRIEATVALGELDVIVPDDVRAEVHSHVGAGSIVLFGEERTGTDVDFDTVDGSDASTATLVLDARTSFGQIVVDRADSITTDGGTP